MIKRVLAGLGLLAAVGGAGPAAVGQCVLDWADGFAAPGMNEPVRALAVFDDGSGPALYVGGAFYTAGAARANYIAKWDGSAWSSVGAGMDFWVDALAVFDDGSGPALYAGGRFATAGGVLVWRVAKWDGSSWSAVGGGVGGYVYALVVFDDGSGPALYAGGEFETAGGVTVNGIAKWDGQSWSALGSGMYGGWPDEPYVSALTVYDDGSGPALYAGGYFIEAGGVTAYGVARWDGAEWSALGMGVNDEARALAVYDDGSGPALYAGGDFTYAGGVSADYIAKWDGSKWSPVGGGVGGIWHPKVLSLGVFDDGSGPGLYVGGHFSTAGGVEVNHIAKWDGVNWSALMSGTTGGSPFGPQVSTLAVFDDGSGAALYAGGDFSTAGEIGAHHVGRWDGAGFSALGGGNGMADVVQALTLFDHGSGPALYAGGRFHAAGTLAVNAIAKWDGQGWSSLGDAVFGYVFALTVLDDGGGPALYAGGGFAVGDVPGTNYIARWDGTTWSALDNGMNDWVAALAGYSPPGADGGALLYAGGWFTSAGGVQANHVAVWDGASWSALGSGTNDYVWALSVFDDGSGPALYAGGEFTSAGGVSANHIAKWNVTGWSALGSGADDSVRVLAVFDDASGPALYAGGVFSMVGGVVASGIAKWDGESWSPVGGGLGEGGAVVALTVFDDGSGDALYAGGGFQTAGGVSANNIAKWDGSRWSALGSGMAPGGPFALTGFDAPGKQSGPALYAGGGFSVAAGAPSVRIARWGCIGDLVLGDVNCDGTVDELDIDPFVLALVDPSAYELTYADCDIRTADCNYDGAVNGFDIDRFVELLSGP